jgi:biopolymer transport protein ExbD
MNFRRGRQREEPEINLVPMIDVMLVILIFLMITTTYSKYTELQINLPTADAEKQPERPNEISVVVSAQGQYTINKAPVAFTSVEQLAQEMRRAGRNLKDPGRHHQRGRQGHAPVGGPHHGGFSRRRAVADHLHHPGHQVTTNFLAQHWSRRTALSRLLWPASVAFGAVARVRRLAYGLGLARAHRAGLPVIVVGNLTVGGSGKTPLVMWIAQELREKGFAPAIVSRGYGGQPRPRARPRLRRIRLKSATSR